MKKIIIYPFFLSLFPVVALLGHNAGELRATDGLRAVVLVLLISACLFLLFRLFLRSWDKAALLTSFLLLLLLSYGHLYHGLRAQLPFGIQVIRHRYLAIVLIFVILLGYHYLRGLQNPGRMTVSLNLISALLLVYPISQLVISEWKTSHEPEFTAVAAEDCRFSLPEERKPPDIYYIILDAYARNDVMKRTYGFDNQAFLDDLTERGFYVANGSQSNYARTGISLDSALNMSYFDLSSGSPIRTEQGNYSTTLSIGNNVVRKELACLGYKIIAFDSGYYWSGWRDADVYLSPVESTETELFSARVNPFESLLVYNSVGLLALDTKQWLSTDLQQAIDDPLLLHRERVLYALEKTGEYVPSLQSPKFVFVHVVSPHPPYVLGLASDSGALSGPFSLRSLTDYSTGISETDGYRNQVRDLNQRVLHTVDGILANSQSPAVIILQGDHGIGSGMNDRMSILNAYYLPSGAAGRLYPTITPVNTFRVIFNAYFEGDMPLLPDHTYFSEYESLFDFTEVINQYTEP